jgi:hypothetical protein
MDEPVRQRLSAIADTGQGPRNMTEAAWLAALSRLSLDPIDAALVKQAGTVVTPETFGAAGASEARRRHLGHRAIHTR